MTVNQGSTATGTTLIPGLNIRPGVYEGKGGFAVAVEGGQMKGRIGVFVLIINHHVVLLDQLLDHSVREPTVDDKYLY